MHSGRFIDAVFACDQCVQELSKSFSASVSSGNLYLKPLSANRLETTYRPYSTSFGSVRKMNGAPIRATHSNAGKPIGILSTFRSVRMNSVGRHRCALYSFAPKQKAVLKRVALLCREPTSIQHAIEEFRPDDWEF